MLIILVLYILVLLLFFFLGPGDLEVLYYKNVVKDTCDVCRGACHQTLQHSSDDIINIIHIRRDYRGQDECVCVLSSHVTLAS